MFAALDARFMLAEALATGASGKPSKETVMAARNPGGAVPLCWSISKVNLKYRVWEEGGLWYWEVLTMRGARLRYGAADQRVAARTEATLCVLDEPARLADQAALEANQLKARREQALMANGCTAARGASALRHRRAASICFDM